MITRMSILSTSSEVPSNSIPLSATAVAVDVECGVDADWGNGEVDVDCEEEKAESVVEVVCGDGGSMTIIGVVASVDDSGNWSKASVEISTSSSIFSSASFPATSVVRPASCVVRPASSSGSAMIISVTAADSDVIGSLISGGDEVLPITNIQSPA